MTPVPDMPFSVTPSSMTPFRCEAIPTETADRFRRTGRDDRGNAVRRIVATPDGGFPCRHCLRPARAGETVLLGSLVRTQWVEAGASVRIEIEALGAVEASFA